MKRAGIVETSPIVTGGVMYITEPPSTVTALDVRTGRPLWTYSPAMPANVRTIGSPPVNRGVAILDDTVFVGTVHGHLIALDAKSGALRWDAQVDDHTFGYFITSAPLALDGRIIIGVSGGEAGIRGFLDAYDPKSGTRLWRTHTIPAPGEPGANTWTGDAWRTGGGSAWLTGSYDPDLNLVYWGTENPGPDWNGTWAERIDEKGRPILKPNTEPTATGTLVFPSVRGASNWPSPSYSPQTRLFYQAAREMGSYFFKEAATYKPGEPFMGESTTGTLKWEFKLVTPPLSGVLSTAGGLVFGGTDEGNFFALDAETGKPLWDTQLGGQVRSNPMSFAVDGKQYVAVAAGYGLFVFGLP